MKLSSYIVTSPYYDTILSQKKILIYSTRTGVIRIVTEEIFDALKSNNFYLFDPSLLKDFEESKILISDNSKELSETLEENQEEIESEEELYKVIMPSANCNFGCDYCGQKHRNEQWSDHQIQIYVDNLKSQLRKKSYRRLHISWFGGEPLTGLSQILKMSEKFLELEKEFRVQYYSSIVTNGLLLTSTVAKKLIEKAKVRKFEITLDGTPQFHDTRRVTKSGKGTFDQIYKNLNSLTKEDYGRIIIRCNVDKRNQEGVSPLIRKLTDDGLHKHVSFYVAPIHSWGNDAEKLAHEKQLFANLEINWLAEMYTLGFKQSFLPRRRKTVCLAVRPNSSVVDTKGDLFNCTELSQVPTYEVNGVNSRRIGTLLSPIDSKKWKILGTFNEKVYNNEVPCSQCSMLPICGGSCPKEWADGSIPCPSFKWNLKDRLLLELASKGTENCEIRSMKENDASFLEEALS